MSTEFAGKGKQGLPLCLGGIFRGPAQGLQFGEDAGERQANYVEIAAFDAGDVTAGEALDGVGSGFVIRFFGIEIGGEFLAGDGAKVNECGFDQLAMLGVGQAHERDSGENKVGAAGKLLEHVARIFGGARLAENFVVEHDNGICGDHNGGTNGTRGYQVGFGEGKTLNECLRRFARIRCFVDGGGENREIQAGIFQNFRATRGRRSKNESHVGLGKNTTRESTRQLCFRAENEARRGNSEADGRAANDSLDDDRFVVFAVDAPEGIRDFADGGVGFDSGENRGEQVFAGAGTTLKFGERGGGFGVVTFGA